MSDSVLSKSARGSAYSIAVSAVTIVLGFSRSVLLIRLLAPDQFGIVTLALFFTTLISPFTNLGIDSALIQKKEVTQTDLSTHFTLRLLLGVGMVGLSLLAAPGLRLFYSSLVVNIFLILMLVHLLEASYATQVVILRRNMRFGALSVLNLVASLAMTLTAPLLAYLGAGLWSLVVEKAVGPLVRWGLIWLVLRPWKPGLGMDRAEAKAELKFGMHLVQSNLLMVLLDRFDDFWTGTALGTTALGYYSRAYEIAQYPERVLATPIVNVFLPVYANLQDEKVELSKAFFRSSAFLVRAGLLLAVLLIAMTPEITLILFTATWLPIVPVFRLMLAYVILNPFYNNLSYLLIGVGRPSLLSRLRLFQVVFFMITVMVLGSLWDINGVALAANAMMLVGTLILIAVSRHFVNYSLRRMFSWPLVAAALAGIAAYLLENAFPGIGIWLRLLVKGTTVSGLYLLVLILAERLMFVEYGLRPIQQFVQQARRSSRPSV